MTPTTLEKGATVAVQAAKLSPEEFREWASDKLQAVESIVQSVIDQVENGKLEPLTGARITSCISGSTFGYEEFHPRSGMMPSAEHLVDSDLYAALSRETSR